jgi:dipeptidyl aminopeptidase/acylaminoacyl peptidase
VLFLEDEEAPGGGSFSEDFTRIAFTETTDRPDEEEWEERVENRDDGYYAEQKLTYSHIWTYEIASGEKVQLTSGSFDNSGATWSPDGSMIAFTSNRTGTRMGDPDRLANNDIFVMSSAGGEERLLTTNQGPDNGPRWSPDGSMIAYTSSDRMNHSADNSDLKIISAAGGEPTNLTLSFDYSVGGVQWSPDGDEIYFTAAEGLTTRAYRISAEGGTPVPVLPDGDYVYSIADRAEDGSRWIVTGTSLADPSTVFLTDDGGQTLRPLFSPNEGLADFELARAETLEWTGPDGWTIEGVLTYPVDYVEGQSYPLVLQIHGGPHGRYSKTFSTGTQIWAGRGYAVLQSNPRGSSGRTLEFSAANVGDWGGKDFEDIMAGVDHVIEMGVADPERMGVMGGSYGGFMTFWTVAQTDRFKGAIGHAGISDWYSFYGQTDIPYLLEFGFGGLPWEAKDTYERWSPVEYSPDVVTPLLITHGEEDTRVPISQAEQYYRSLKKLGNEVEFLRFPREGHGISEPRHRIFLDQEQEKWFARYVLGRMTTEEPSDAGWSPEM